MMPQLKNSDPNIVWLKESKDFTVFLSEYIKRPGLGIIDFPHKRMVIISQSKEYMIIVDLIEGKGKKLIEQIFHLDCKKINDVDNGVELEHKNQVLSLLSFSNEKLNTEITERYFSSYYGKIEKKPVIVFKSKSKLPIAICSIISPNNAKDIDATIKFEKLNMIKLFLKMKDKVESEINFNIEISKNDMKPIIIKNGKEIKLSNKKIGNNYEK